MSSSHSSEDMFAGDEMVLGTNYSSSMLEHELPSPEGSSEDMFAEYECPEEALSEDMFAEYECPEDMFAGEDFEKDSIASKDIIQGGSNGFKYSEELRWKKLLYNRSGLQQWYQDHVLATAMPTEVGVTSLVRSMFGASSCQVESLPRLRAILLVFLRNNRRTNYRHLAKRCVGPTSRRPNDLSATPRSEVLGFVRRALAAVLPPALVGGRRNNAVLDAAVVSVTKLELNEPICVGFVMARFAVSKVRWLADGTAHAVRMNLAAMVMKWLLVDFVVPLIASQFYVTNRKGSLNKLFFFYKPVWLKIENAAISSMCQRLQLLPLDAVDANDAADEIRGGGVPADLTWMRLLPKTDGTARPIMKPSSRIVSDEVATLKLLLQQLVQLEAGNNVDMGVHQGIEQILGSARKKFPGHLVMVAMDIQDAYGSVDHLLLSRILHQTFVKWLKDKPVKLVTVQKIVNGKRVFSTQFDFPGIDLGPVMNILCSKTLQQDQIERLFVAATEFYSRVRVGYGNRRFLLTRGLPQGGLLSPSLCELYYSTMDKRHLARFTCGGVLTRAVDDYLFLTNNIKLANEFQQLMEKGWEDFGCSVNVAKTQTTVPPRNAGHVQFCGLVLNAETLAVSIDIKKYIGLQVGACSIVRSRPHGMEQKMRLVSERVQKEGNRLNKVLCNAQLNGQAGVLDNVRVCSFLAVCRMVGLAHRLFSRSCQLDQMAIDCTLTTANKIASKVFLLSGEGVSYNAALSVSLAAFEWRLRRVPGRYGSVVFELKSHREHIARRLSREDQLLVENVNSVVPEEFRSVW